MEELTVKIRQADSIELAKIFIDIMDKEYKNHDNNLSHLFLKAGLTSYEKLEDYYPEIRNIVNTIADVEEPHLAEAANNFNVAATVMGQKCIELGIICKAYQKKLYSEKIALVKRNTGLGEEKLRKSELFICKSINCNYIHDTLVPCPRCKQNSFIKVKELFN